jgi:Ankyrin repeat
MADCSFVETMPDTKPRRGQYHFTFGWYISFSGFMNGIEWLAEARQMPDTTPLFIHLPLTMNIATKTEYYDGGVWEVCVTASEAAVVHSGNFEGAGPLLDIHNAVTQNKPIDLMCETGTLALITPFSGVSWEFGRFTVASAMECVKLDILKAVGHEPSFLEWLLGIGEEWIAKLARRIRLAGAGPVLREAAYYDDIETVELVFEQCPWLRMETARLQGPLGATPLHIAASNDSVRVLTLLLEKNAY